MTEKAHHGNAWMPVLYASFFGILKDVAFKHGYALAIHGSLLRDMDLIAVPWIETPKDPIKMLAAMNKALGNKLRRGESPYSSVGEKPHGRKAFTIPTGGGGYLDISVMPAINQKGKL